MRSKPILGSILVLGLALAQPNPPLPPGPKAPAVSQPQGPYAGFQGEKAFRAVAKAQARQAEWQGLRLAPSPWVAQGEALLRQAQADLRAQRFFQAKERAEAAKKVYEAALLLNRPSWTSGKPPKGDPGKRLYEAQEKVRRLEAELAYHRQNLPSAQALLQAARGLLSPQAGPLQAEAAHKLAEAGRHALKAERGF